MSTTSLEDVLSCENLPSLPAIAVRLLEMTSSPHVSFADIAKLVQQDQAMAAKVLKTVNSSFYGLSKPCGSISRAMSYLGLNTVKSLVLVFSLVDVSQSTGGNEFDLEAHWRRSIISATGTRALARAVGGVDAEEAFTAALLQDMGMLAAYASIQSEYMFTILGVPHRAVCKAESEAFGFDHTHVGAELATKWKLPEAICEAIRCHHDPDRAQPEHIALTRMVFVGSLISDAIDDESSKSAVRKIERLTRDWYAKKAPDVGELLGEVAETSQILAKMFGQEIGEIPDPELVMAQAQE